ncbi:hypothetical protein [Streptomyces sp. NPDC127020]|uniref:hypothetical protein n=1 Tax=Streptomyces sp. NPDC127020 TaxID=3347109 RepID=UPI00364C8EDC
MASFTHVTPERCAQLGGALDAVRLAWSDNGCQLTPQYLNYTVTDQHGRTWRINPATNFQISPSAPGRVWQASCAELMRTSAILSARQVADHIKHAPA